MRTTAKTLKQRFETRLRCIHQKRHDNKNHRRSTLQMPNADWVAEQLTRFNSISAGLHYFCATGNMQGGGRGGRSGCCQILERTSELQMQSCMNKVVTPLDAQAAPTCARQLRPDMLGYLCPAATPEGKRTGLINQRAVGASVSRQRFSAVPALLDIIDSLLVASPTACGAKHGGVWISGRFVGNTVSCTDVARVIRGARREGQVPRDVGVSVYGDVAVEIRVHSGRMLKPLIPVVAKRLEFSDEHDVEPFNPRRFSRNAGRARGERCLRVRLGQARKAEAHAPGAVPHGQSGLCGGNDSVPRPHAIPARVLLHLTGAASNGF